MAHRHTVLGWLVVLIPGWNFSISVRPCFGLNRLPGVVFQTQILSAEQPREPGRFWELFEAVRTVIGQRKVGGCRRVSGGGQGSPPAGGDRPEDGLHGVRSLPPVGRGGRGRTGPPGGRRGGEFPARSEKRRERFGNPGSEHRFHRVGNRLGVWGAAGWGCWTTPRLSTSPPLALGGGLLGGGLLGTRTVVKLWPVKI